MTVLEVRNPNAWLLDPYRVLVALAFAGDKSQVQPGVVLDELTQHTGSDALRVFVGREGEALKAMAMLFLPRSALMPAGLYHFYNRGSPDLRRAMVGAVVEAARSAGYTAIQTANVNGRDAAFERLAKDLGRPHRLGSLYRFDLPAGEGECQGSAISCSDRRESPARS